MPIKTTPLRKNLYAATPHKNTDSILKRIREILNEVPPVGRGGMYVVMQAI